MIDQLYDLYINSTGVSTDTRTIKKDNLWIALKGPNFDANKFADQALEKGACSVVVDDPSVVKDERYFLVEDGLEALQALSKHHRSQLSIPFIGITGSNGKTTTKELMRDVLAKKYRVHATKGNLNNHIGVPLTLLQIGSDIDLAIIEMGANSVGEIAELCGFANPTHGLITNIGKAHLEGFGGIEGVIRGKTELYHHLIESNGIVFVNSKSEILSNIARKRIKSPIFYSGSEDFLSIELLESQPVLTFRSENNKKIKTQLTGTYNFENICAALCVGKYFEVEENDMLSAVTSYIPDNNRSQILKKGSNTIVLDAYNANPSSMEAALVHFSKGDAARKIVILGDMFELGEDAAKEHEMVGRLTASYKFDEVHLCGELMSYGKLGNSKARHWSKKEDLEKYLSDHPIKNATILIKGSRGMSLETLIEDLA